MSLLRAGIRGLTSSLHAESGAAGASRAKPAAINADTVAGPWKMTVLQVQTGADAAAAVTTASKFNVAPRDGSAYLVVKVRAQNTSNRDYDIEPDDFGVTGSSNVVSRFSQQIPPDPVLNGTVKAGATLEGSIVAEIPADETNLLLVYDSLSISGSWSDAVFALAEGAAIADAGKIAAAKNDAGTKVGSSAQIGDEIVTDEWAVKLIETASGATDVGNLFPSSDYRTTALLGTGSDNGSTWLALHVQVKNVRAGGAASFLPATAFLLVTNDGKPVNDVTLLTPPDPDVSGAYYPGGSRDGWVLFEQPDAYPDSIVRFLPFVTDGDPRYFNFGGGSAQPTPPAATVAPGAKVTVSEDVVNLRSQPSTSGKIVVVLKKGDELTVTGTPIAGDNYQWYPVKVDSTGQTGYIATNFVAPA